MPKAKPVPAKRVQFTVNCTLLPGTRPEDVEEQLRAAMRRWRGRWSPAKNRYLPRWTHWRITRAEARATRG